MPDRAFQIRTLMIDDVPAMVAIQAECYPAALHEDAATMYARIAVAPDTAWVAEDEAGVCGYLVAYPSLQGRVTRLSSVFRIPDQPDTLYLHDLAVGQRGRGRGIGRALAQQAHAKAHDLGLHHLALVSVQGTQPFWRALGYELYELPAQERSHLATYIIEATYMSRSLNVPETR